MKVLTLVNKKILYDKSPIIYNKKLDETWREDWQVMAGEWSQQDGALIGIERGNRGGILLYKERFTKNVMMTFTVNTVLPATRDLNAVFCASWDEDKDDLGDAYVCGLNGWYEHKAGIERNVKGGGNAFAALSATAFDYEYGTDIKMTVGAIDGHCFMYVNDKLVCEVVDGNNPLTEGRIGFSPYCTILKIKDIEIREIKYEPFLQSYEPEF